jgi:hypothetical protein
MVRSWVRLARAFRGRWVRVEIWGEGGGSRVVTLPAAGVVWLGRASDCEVVLDAPGIAPRHLSIFTRERTLFVRDHAARAALPGQLVHDALRRLSVPAQLELGPYRVHVSLAGPCGFDLGRLKVALGCAGPLGGLRAHGWLLLLAGIGLALGLGRVLLRAAPVPPAAAAQCAVDRAGAQRGPAPPAGPISVLRAVQLLRAGRRVEALAQYRALSALDDSPAQLAVVTELLEYELACPR